ncbi:MAG: four helix bundle protein [Cytophagaceae bacterium]|jgi:four helix bundle protein|nr:four helix bundle protein [Cytophagaceae bacterium]
MTTTSNNNAQNPADNKRHDLEKRTAIFAYRCRLFIRKLPKDVSNFEDCKRLARATGSIGAAYIAANDALSRKDFMLNIKLCKKEAKESIYWLNLLLVQDPEISEEKGKLKQEAFELLKIFSSILTKVKKASETSTTDRLSTPSF